jgi:hypothetical protein
MWASHRRCRAVRCPVVSLLVLDKCCTARALCHLAWSGPHRHAGAPIKTGHRSPPIFSFILTRLSSPPPFPPLQRLQLQPHLTLESKPPPPPNLLFREPLSAGHPLSIPPRLSPLSTSPCCRNRRRPQELRRCTEPLLLPHQHHTVWVSPRPHHLAGPVVAMGWARRASPHGWFGRLLSRGANPRELQPWGKNLAHHCSSNFHFLNSVILLNVLEISLNFQNS